MKHTILSKTAANSSLNHSPDPSIKTVFHKVRQYNGNSTAQPSTAINTKTNNSALHSYTSPKGSSSINNKRTINDSITASTSHING